MMGVIFRVCIVQDEVFSEEAVILMSAEMSLGGNISFKLQVAHRDL